MIREAANRLKNIVAKKDIVPILTQFVVRGGFMYASDGILTAGTPVGKSETFAVRASEFQKFVDRTPGDLKIKVDENGHLKVTAGRFRAEIRGTPPDQVPIYEAPKGKVVKISETLLDNLKALRPFLSDNATQAWAANVAIRDGKLFATNNVVLVQAIENSLKGLEFTIPYEIVDVVLSQRAGVKSLVLDERSIAFTWDDTSWVKSQLKDGGIPAFEKVIESVPNAKWVMTDDWRESFLHLADFSQGEIKIAHDKIIARTETGSEITADVSCALLQDGEQVTFSGAFLEPVVKEATKLLFFEANGPRAAFSTKYIKGVVAGIGSYARAKQSKAVGA
jgi:hypothetical protein